MWRGIILVFFSCFCIACGSDLEFGTNKKDGLRIGKGGESSFRFGAKAGGGQSGTRRVEETVVQGNIFNLRPATARPLLVFVFVDLRDPGTFQDFRDAEVGIIGEDRSFSVSHLAAGDLTIVFLLDQVGVNQDGTIDRGDPIALFQDTSGRLKGLSASTELTLEDVDVSFDLNAPDSGTATVRSEGNIIVRQE
ncbi:MAG: hypothetical protein FJ147_02185 [Deltaproteobacteria bacterium]|nr:hypothetical protein [Deltaproteobacteria bacterium]